MKTSKEVIIGILVCLCVFLTYSLFKAKRGVAKPLKSYLVAVADPNWIDDYGVDLESRLVYNVALLNQIVNRQGIVLERLLEDPNK